jgi:hypothetical protein
MDKSRWISLSIAGIYVLVLISGLVFSGDIHNLPNETLVRGAIGAIFWLVISLGLIWYGDELGEGLVGAYYGLVSEKSPGWAIQLMGWIFLLIPTGIFLWYILSKNKY